MRELDGYKKQIEGNATQGKMDMADRYAVAAMQLVSKNPAGYNKSWIDIDVLTPVKDLISSYRKNGNYSKADYLTNWYYSTIQAVYGSSSINLVDALKEYASTLEAQSKLGEAEGRYKQAIAVADKAPFIDTFGKLKMLTVVMSYTQMLQKMGREQDAQKVMDTYNKKYQ